MSLDVEKQLTFYGAYHHNRVNVIIHMICVPLILFSAFEIASNYGPFFTLPSWLQVPYLEPNLGTFAALTWGGLYLLLEPVAGGALALICLGAAAGTNYLRLQDPAGTTRVAVAVHIVCWLLQFIGHGKFEGRAPALLDNLFQAIFLAPLFVWLELLFALGYRPELQKRVNKAVELEIAKFRERKAKKAGKTQ
ncbi:uncharacterized protein THITE_2149855 [Thermothielavioides terrestris NRRL 8126]|uniref:DUF962 domain-containing protein n=1 Tax=Thermothielavioides terrestris (strain ATCC 38088 / NRRL 8126) TaxID=578455 RepID=G2QY64_THETT|nr:uncharacterized protein THITE_2149855 [Thermothielavioides terrestris NRRL 8126]AEO65358.1 hypothetical protein THITE_2149855 [Thermothielavioides terrestris NRRL 8126]